MLGDEGVDEQRWSQKEDVQAQKNTNESSTKHGQGNFLESQADGQA
jgi:hypothetical protein